MALELDTLTNAMVAAGQQLGGSIWQDMQVYAAPELQKIATQIVAIETAMLLPDPPYTTAGAQALLNMQVTASAGIVVAMTTLTLLAVQTAINAILAAVKDMVNSAVPFPLIA